MLQTQEKVLFSQTVDWGDTGEQYDLTGEIMTIDKEMAAAFLLTSRRNRNTKGAHVTRLKEMMSSNDYYALYNPICFDYDGCLLDGHHRLEALRDTDIVHDFFVVKGYPPEAYWVMDQVKPRSARDNLTSAGQALPGVRDKAVKMIYRLDRRFGKTTETAPTNVMFERYFQKHPELEDYCTLAHKDYVEVGWKEGPTAMLRYLYDAIDKDLAKEFWEGLRHGFQNSVAHVNDPRRILFEKLEMENNKADETSGARAIRTNFWAIWVHDAWTNFAAAKDMKSIGPESSYDSVWSNLIQCVRTYRPSGI
jgi:hypothetical protein